MKYEKVIVIGYGKVTGEVLKTIHDTKQKYGFDLCYIEHEVHPFNTALDFCTQNNIPHQTIQNKKDLTVFFKNISENTLIISASNNYLFPIEITDKKNITIINFHNALLPKYPGRNAPSWAIFYNEKETGITWHYVNSQIDAGDIIIQKKCDISSEQKAYELGLILMNLASSAFYEIWEDVYNQKVKPTAQPKIENQKLYLSKEIPNNGYFSTDDNPVEIYKFLRALDWGKNGIFPNAKTHINNDTVEILRYKKVTAKDTNTDNTIYLPMGDEYLKLKYRKIEE